MDPMSECPDPPPSPFKVPAEVLRSFQDARRLVGDVLAQHAEVVAKQAEDLSRVLETHRSAWLALMPSFKAAEQASAAVQDLAPHILAAFRRALPPNWWGCEASMSDCIDVLRVDGIPLAWVPRGEIVTEIVGAHQRLGRLAVLRERRDDVVADCRGALSECDHADIAAARSLADRALEAFSDGHLEAAQALAVVVAERLIRDRFPGRRTYDDARLAAELNDGTSIPDMRRAFALAPVSFFYASWWPDSGVAPPSQLNRHVSVHHPTSGQYDPDNALLAVMLVASLLRQAQDELEAELE